MRARSDVVAEVCARIATGESVRSIFDAQLDGFPNHATWWRWVAADADIRKSYEAAIEARSEKYAEEIAAIADETPPQVETQFGSHMDAAYVNWQKNRIDARRWTASKLLSKKYGDRTVLAGDADNPLFEVADPRAALLSGLTPKPTGDGPDSKG